MILPWVFGNPVWWLASFTIPLVPIAITFSVLRYHLYGIDTLITRALVGAGLVGVIGGVYVAVGTASSLFLSDVDRIGGLIAALCAGAFFHPIRRVLQRGADRLLYGSKGDPVALAAELGRRLQRTDPAGGLAAALEVLRDGLAVTGTGVRFSGGRPKDATAGTLEEVARDIRLVWHGEPVGRLLIGPPGARHLPPRTMNGSSPRSHRTWRTRPTRSGWSARCNVPGSGSSPPARRSAAASAATCTTVSASHSAGWRCPSTWPGTPCASPRDGRAHARRAALRDGQRHQRHQTPGVRPATARPG